MGVVTGIGNIDANPPTVTCTVGGDTTNQELPYLANYSPSIGDVIMLLSIPGDMLVIGAVAMENTPRRYYGSFTPNSSQVFTTGTLTTLTNLSKLTEDVIGPSAMVLSTGQWTPPFPGVYLFTFGVNIPVTGSRIILNIQKNTVTVGGIDYSATGNVHSTAAVRQMGSGDVAQWRLQQGSGASQSITAGDQSKITITSLMPQGT
jgi:hypothetical protein